MDIVDLLIDVIPDSEVLSRVAEALTAMIVARVADLATTLGTVTSLAKTFEAERDELRRLLRAHGIEAVQA